MPIGGRARPIALVLAGTPGLETTLGAAGASFWSRGVTLPIGLLSDEEAHAVLARTSRTTGGQLQERDLDIVLDRHDGGRADLKEFLKATGFIWREAPGQIWTPGIPSLMGHIIAVRERKPSPEQDRALKALLDAAAEDRGRRF